MVKYLFGAILSLFITGTALAAEPDLLFSQSHDYSVTMRGNGESIVYARVHLNNTTDNPLKTFEFEIPKLSSPELVGYQVILPLQCAQYDKSKPASDSKVLPCLKYSEPEYGSGMYIPENTEFKKLKFTHQGDKYAIEMPNPVEVNKSTLLVFSFIGRGYVSESLGLFKFDFETLKVNSRIKNIQVTVDVDSDLVLEGQKAKVNYGQNAIDMKQPLEANTDNVLRGTVQSIGMYGGVFKQAKNLAPGETLTVKGKYAESYWRLYLDKIVMAIIILAITIGGLVWFSRRSKSKKTTFKSGFAVNSSVPTSKINHLVLLDSICIGAGLVSAILVFGATVILTFSFRNTYSYNVDPVSQIVIAILLVIFYSLAVLAPAIWLAATRRDWHVFINVILWQFIFLLILFFIYQFGFKGIFENLRSSEPVPMIGCPDC